MDSEEGDAPLKSLPAAQKECEVDASVANKALSLFARNNTGTTASHPADTQFPSPSINTQWHGNARVPITTPSCPISPYGTVPIGKPFRKGPIGMPPARLAFLQKAHGPLPVRVGIRPSDSGAPFPRPIQTGRQSHFSPAVGRSISSRVPLRPTATLTACKRCCSHVKTSEILTHVVTCHSEGLPRYCQLCNYESNNQFVMVQHMLDCHNLTSNGTVRVTGDACQRWAHTITELFNGFRGNVEVLANGSNKVVVTRKVTVHPAPVTRQPVAAVKPAKKENRRKNSNPRKLVDEEEQPNNCERPSVSGPSKMARAAIEIPALTKMSQDGPLEKEVKLEVADEVKCEPRSEFDDQLNNMEHEVDHDDDYEEEDEEEELEDDGAADDPHDPDWSGCETSPEENDDEDEEVDEEESNSGRSSQGAKKSKCRYDVDEKTVDEVLEEMYASNRQPSCSDMRVAAARLRISTRVVEIFFDLKQMNDLVEKCGFASVMDLLETHADISDRQVTLTDEQMIQLKSFYVENPRPTRGQYGKWADELKVSKSDVMKTVYNFRRRLKLKKDQHLTPKEIPPGKDLELERRTRCAQNYRRFTASQVRCLVKAFKENPEIGGQELNDLAESLQVNRHSVTNWIYRQRQKAVPAMVEIEKGKEESKASREHNNNGEKKRNSSSFSIKSVKSRRAFSAEEKDRLNALFNENPSPTRRRMEKIAIELGMPYNSVYRFFDNARNLKKKKEFAQSEEYTSALERIGAAGIARLEEVFKRNNRPLLEERTKVAEEVGTSYYVVTYWFQKRLDESRNKLGPRLRSKSKRARRSIDYYSDTEDETEMSSSGSEEEDAQLECLKSLVTAATGKRNTDSASDSDSGSDEMMTDESADDAEGDHT